MRVHPVPERENICVGLVFLLAAVTYRCVLAKEMFLESFTLAVTVLKRSDR